MENKILFDLFSAVATHFDINIITENGATFAAEISLFNCEWSEWTTIPGPIHRHAYVDLPMDNQLKTLNA